MKGITLVLILLSFNLSSQIKELQKAQDVRKDHFNSNTQTSDKNFSKSMYVDPFIGTGGHGHTYPGASAPFGMMQLSPDTRHDGWDGCSGYHYSDSLIYGFSHTHLSGTGVPDYCDLLIVPQFGAPKIDPGYEISNGYQASFDHAKEKASPGYYEVELDEGDMNVRLTVSERAGFHEYTFNNRKGKKFILIDLDHRDKLLHSEINILDKNTISGKRKSKAWAEEQYFNFYIKTDVPYQKARKFMKKGRHKLLLIFPRKTKKINLKVGISAVDIRGAKLNLEKEIPGWNFNQTRAVVTKQWNKELDRIYFYSKDKAVMTNFYTALYHSYLNPNLFSDVDGRYRGMDKEVHQLENLDHKNYTVFSLWDTYRATHPLFTLTQQRRTNEFLETFQRHYNESGDLPVWELAGNETECMIGYHSVSVIADAYVKDIFLNGAPELINAMRSTSNESAFGKDYFAMNGYVNANLEPESVSKTLEYAYDDFCIAQMLKKYRNNTEDLSMNYLIDEYENRSFNFLNVYDPSTKFMRGRRSGQWFTPFDPAEVNFNYTEANSWQYSLYAPHAVGVLSNQLGGKDSLENWLDRLFHTESNLSGRHQVDITGLIGQYAHGNEPSHHMAYLYNYTNSPHKTQKYVDSILNTMYSNTPDGLSGNEDCGQMSSWYVLSALGIYQIAPGNPYYEIGRPLLDKASIQFENGNVMKFKTLNKMYNNKYIGKVMLNGKELKRNYFTHEELNQGGEIVYYMSKEPNRNRNKYPHAPTIEQVPNHFQPVPFFENSERIFEDSAVIVLNVLNADSSSIQYTTDGTDPRMSETARTYNEPFTIYKSTNVRAFASHNAYTSSSIANRFVKKNENVSIKIKSIYANQYAADGDLTLIDGIHGNNEYRTGDWQGYWDQDFEAEITFEQPIKLSEVGLGALSDMKSWIFLPSIVSFAVTYEGESAKQGVSIISDKETEVDMYPHHENFTIKLDNSKLVKKIWVKANTSGNCPDWHLGSGNPTWLFVDEIFFK